MCNRSKIEEICETSQNRKNIYPTSQATSLIYAHWEKRFSVHCLKNFFKIAQKEKIIHSWKVIIIEFPKFNSTIVKVKKLKK